MLLHSIHTLANLALKETKPPSRDVEAEAGSGPFSVKAVIKPEQMCW